jgi:hypothetical protein
MPPVHFWGTVKSMGRSESRILLCQRSFAAIPLGMPLSGAGYLPTSWWSLSAGGHGALSFARPSNISNLIEFMDFMA